MLEKIVSVEILDIRRLVKKDTNAMFKEVIAFLAVLY